MRLPIRFLTLTLTVSVFTLIAAAADGFIGGLHHIDKLTSTVPANGDVNPYGVAVVPNTVGELQQGSILVSNFNNFKNLQGTGTTIVEISPTGQLKTFAQIPPSSLPGPCPGGVGLTTALAVLRTGFVIVGSLPTSDGTSATAQAGCLIVLNSNGKPVSTISGNGINGPWDMTSVDLGTTAMIFVTNVLNDTVAADGSVVYDGTVLRITLATLPGQTPSVLASTVVASGFGERTDPSALVIGPTGLGLSLGTLYVADTVGNRIAAIPNALSRSNSGGIGQIISEGGFLNSPLGLAIAPNGDIVVVNAQDGNMVEVTPGGDQLVARSVDVSKEGAGTLFGLAIAPQNGGVYYVDDGNNTFNLLH